MADTSPKRRNIAQTPFELIETNRIPILVGAIIFVGTLAFFMYKTQANHKQAIMDNRPQPKIDVSQKDGVRQWFQDDKYDDNNYSMKKIAVKSAPSTPQEIQQQLVTNQEMDFKQEELNDDYAARLEIEKLEEKQKVEEKKMEIAAASSPMNVEVPSPPGAKSSLVNKGGVVPAANESSALAQVTKGIKLPTAVEQAVEDINHQDEKKDFLKDKDNEDGDYLKYSLVKPKSPHEVKAGTYIPATLVGGINSDLPGPVTAQVSQNVYDTVTGNDILIPQGTRIIGQYDSKVTFGQSSALVVWNRLIFPDGKSIDLGSMQGVDISGYAGLHDKLNNHYLKIYGNALLLSLVGAGYDLLNNQQNNNPNSQYNAQQVVAANVGQKLSDVSNQTLQKNMDVQPTITVAPGYRFNVIVLKDMILEKIDDVEGSLAYTS
jgi:type IV secretion system protein VirB10